MSVQHCGYVAIIGRPNVGKSTLLNRILGQKIAITSRKAQTTRHRILGIKTHDHVQAIYVDTPGIHQAGKKVMNRLLNKAALDSLHDVDLVVFVVDGTRWLDEDQYILDKLGKFKQPILLAVNKIDQIDDREVLLPHLEFLSSQCNFAAIVPISAQKGENLAALEREVEARLPASPAYFPEDQITDRSQRFLTAELIREKLTRNLGQELPYSLTVEIEKYDDQGELVSIYALIWLERESQKAIVIGKNGQLLKKVGTQVRLELERNLERKVYLQLWVRVKDSWADDERALRDFGYE
ncbi:MAG: GTPase Era [Gammaproteobacteria bacterium]|nr:GTPase Era [Gammaproteobacteria bacterium]